MTNFTPGQTVKTFSTKAGQPALIRYPLWEDLNQVVTYVNRLSQEDTYTTFMGELITKEEEARFLADLFLQIELGHKVFLFCFVEKDLVGICGLSRNTQQRLRGRHVGRFGISIDRKARGEGLGYELAQATIAEAKKKIPGLRVIVLDVYDKNQIAQNLYRKLGFQDAGKIPRAILYQGNYLDEMKMYLELASV